jgi:hypothetical protein
MPISNIVVLGNTIGLVTLPSTGGALASIDWTASTSVAIVESVFTGTVQSQIWPGADTLSGVATLPPLTQKQAKPWKAALMQMQGMQNAFQLGDPLTAIPQGHVQGSPVVDGSVAVVAGGQILYTKGWTASQINLLLPGDRVQVGFRYYTVLDTVISDATGKSAINIWPSLREVPVDGQQVVTTNAVGLWRLAANKVTWSESFDRLCHCSFSFREYR